MVLAKMNNTSRASSCFTVLLLRGKSGACCSTVFLMSINFSCPHLHSSTTCLATSSPRIPSSPYTVYYNNIINNISMLVVTISLLLIYTIYVQVMYKHATYLGDKFVYCTPSFRFLFVFHLSYFHHL